MSSLAAHLNVGSIWPIAARPLRTVRPPTLAASPQFIILIFRQPAVQSSQIESIFAELGGLKGLYRLKGKPYAVLQFDSIDRAIQAKQRFHGKYSADIDKLVLLDYAASLPEALSQHTIQQRPDQSEHSSSNQIPPPPMQPSGLFVIPNFISEAEEAALIASIDSVPLSEWTQLNHRRVAHFGYEFSYKTRNVERAGGQVVLPHLPSWTSELTKKMEVHPAVPLPLDQLTINNYEAGDGIPHHIDTHSAFDGPILSLSLLSDIIMEFRHPEGAKIDVVVPRRSLIIMSGDSRLLWSHGITPRKTDQFPGGVLNIRRRRVSLTFRTVRSLERPCECPYWAQCDRRKESARLAVAPLIEQKYVHDVYNQIGEHFSSTRHSPWPWITKWLESLPAGTLLADIGCGNGRYFGVNPGVYKIGVERSEALTKICAQNKSFEPPICGDILSIPLKPGQFDVVMCIAVLHHLSTQERRLAAVQQLLRLCKPGGQLLIYVWALEQPERSFGQPDLFVPWHLPTAATVSLPPEQAQSAAVETQSIASDVPMVTAPASGELYTMYKRFYHVFRTGELQDLLVKAGDCQIELPETYEKGNFRILVRKQ